MKTLPSLALLEATHKFPGPYTFKAIGHYDSEFAPRIVALVRYELGLNVDPPFSTRTSAEGRHLSVTIEPVVQSAAQVLAVYERLRHVAGLLVML